ncbi:MAG: HWE histidine kinase domain-containing protein, partial [Caulobacteraceae bacterium]
SMATSNKIQAASRWRGADIASIAAAELGALAPGQARWRGDEVLLNPRATNALTLALHELAANAVKYGALSTEAGRVDVAWRLRPEGGFDLDWREREGPGVKPPKRRGFGSVLLERVTGRELGGRAEIEFASDGVRARISADASALASSPAEGGQSGVPSRRGETGGASLGAPVGGDVDGVRVLVVEDAVLLALELEAGLAEAGAEVVGTASNLEEAQKMASLPFDVAVLDANLNGKSVLPVAEALCAQRKPFIFATGYGDDLPAPEGFGAPVVRKPYNVHQITVALAEALGRGS